MKRMLGIGSRGLYPPGDYRRLDVTHAIASRGRFLLPLLLFMASLLLAGMASQAHRPPVAEALGPNAVRSGIGSTILSGNDDGPQEQ